jgi:Alpha-N-acetylglucosaminidase (NAGLU) C-terminal domain
MIQVLPPCHRIGDGPHSLQPLQCLHSRFQQTLCARRHSPPQLEHWVELYALRRYGTATPPAVVCAWQTLAATVYSCLDGAVDHVRPCCPLWRSSIGMEDS